MDAVAIVNRGLDKIGVEPIVALTDSTKQGRWANRNYAALRDLELTLHTWRFSVARTTLAAEATAPAFGYARQFPLPADFLRLISAGDIAPGIDLTEVRQSLDGQDYSIEGTKILTSLSAPLQIRYVRKVTNTEEFPPYFAEVLACRIAVEAAPSLTDSNPRTEKAMVDYDMAVRTARRANAIQQPPMPLADDSWVVARGV